MVYKKYTLPLSIFVVFENINLVVWTSESFCPNSYIMYINKSWFYSINTFFKNEVFLSNSSLIENSAIDNPNVSPISLAWIIASQVFTNLDPFLGDCLKEMVKLDRFDLDSRKGKNPGGYNYPLEETGFPFIFMNAAGQVRDMVTLLHEGGHAVHSILTKLMLRNY